MQTNEAGKSIIKACESLALKAYHCPAGILTNGYGHTGLDVHEGQVIDEDQAECWLSEDLHEAEQIVSEAVKVPLNENQFSALVSFVFNVGHGRPDFPGHPGKDGFVVLRNGNPSSMLRLLNAGDYKSAANQFSFWTRAAGVELSGLVKRRTMEQQLFDKAV